MPNLPYSSWVVFDLEWEPKSRLIYAASFIDHKGNKFVEHLDDIKPNVFSGANKHKQMIDRIMRRLMVYECSIAWGSKGPDSDLDTIHYNAQLYGLPSIYNPIYKMIEGREHIDLLKVFGKKLVQISVYENRYRDLKLDTVAKCFLGRGKLSTGLEAAGLSTSKQKEYVLEDAQLVRELLEVGMWDDEADAPKMNGELMQLMGSIAQLVQITYSKACNSGLSAWWEKILKDEGAPFSDDRFKVQKGVGYKGGEVYDPTPGAYNDVIVVDVQSLYPTMAINYNLSHETICCVCCKDDPKARIPAEIIDKGYWVCRKQAGIFARKLSQFKAERVKHKKAGNEVMSGGLKILINGGYGCYGFDGFKYSDRRVAELITACGRYTTFQRIKPIAEKYNFQVLAGDTDSLFLKHINHEGIDCELQRHYTKTDVEQLIYDVQQELNVVLEHDKDFKKICIVKKKHYFGVVTKKGKEKIVTKGMEWKKGDRSAWVNEAGDAFEQAFKNGQDCFKVVTDALDAMFDNKLDVDKLKIGVKLTKNPEEYAKDSAYQKKVGTLCGAKAGEVAYYWKGVDGPTLDPKQIDKNAYKDLLLACFEDSLKIMGYSTKIFGEKWVAAAPGQGTLDALFAAVWPPVQEDDAYTAHKREQFTSIVK